MINNPYTFDRHIAIFSTGDSGTIYLDQYIDNIPEYITILCFPENHVDISNIKKEYININSIILGDSNILYGINNITYFPNLTSLKLGSFASRSDKINVDFTTLVFMNRLNVLFIPLSVYNVSILPRVKVMLLVVVDNTIKELKFSNGKYQMIKIICNRDLNDDETQKTITLSINQELYTTELELCNLLHVKVSSINLITSVCLGYKSYITSVEDNKEALVLIYDKYFNDKFEDNEFDLSDYGDIKYIAYYKLPRHIHDFVKLPKKFNYIEKS